MATAMAIGVSREATYSNLSHAELKAIIDPVRLVGGPAGQHMEVMQHSTVV